MKSKNIALLVAFSFLLFSCDFVKEAYKEKFEEQSDTEQQQRFSDEENVSVKKDYPDTPKKVVKNSNLLEDAKKLDAIQAQLQEMFPEKSLEIYAPHIYFETKRIRLKLKNPEIPDHIDWYYYKTATGKWEKEDPVKTRANFQEKSIPLDAIKFSTANKVYHQLVQKAETIEGAEIPTTIYFSFHVPQWNWNAQITGSRSDYDFKTDKDGKEIEFKRL